MCACRRARPTANERPYLLIPVGYRAPEAVVPAIGKKPLAEIMAVVGWQAEGGHQARPSLFKLWLVCRWKSAC